MTSPAPRPVGVTGPTVRPETPACCSCGNGRKGGWLCWPCFEEIDSEG